MKFKREMKYLVLKWDDIDKYLLPKDGDLLDMRETLMWIVETVDARRKAANKALNNYVVVNEDEPYAEQVWKLIQECWEAREGKE